MSVRDLSTVPQSSRHYDSLENIKVVAASGDPNCLAGDKCRQSCSSQLSRCVPASRSPHSSVRFLILQSCQEEHFGSQ